MFPRQTRSGPRRSTRVSHYSRLPLPPSSGSLTNTCICPFAQDVAGIRDGACSRHFGRRAAARLPQEQSRRCIHGSNRSSGACLYLNVILSVLTVSCIAYSKSTRNKLLEIIDFYFRTSLKIRTFSRKRN